MTDMPDELRDAARDVWKDKVVLPRELSPRMADAAGISAEQYEALKRAAFLDWCERAGLDPKGFEGEPDWGRV